MNNHSLNILNWDYDTVPKSSWLVSVTEEQNRDWLNNYFFKKNKYHWGACWFQWNTSGNYSENGWGKNGSNTADLYIFAIRMEARVNQTSKDPNAKEDEK